MTRCATAAVVLGVALIAVGPASAFDRPPLLERVASQFAKREAEVRCPSMTEWLSDPIWGSGPITERGWGYTNMRDDYIVLHPALCAAALAISDATVPAWERAAGVLVLVHEAYHLRRWRWRWSEGKVECQAIRHFTPAAKLLGASGDLANDLLPYALAVHARMVRLFDNYRDARCKLPLWAPPIAP